MRKMTKKLKKHQSNQRYQYGARVGMRGNLFFGGGGGLQGLGLVLHLI